MQQNLRMHAGTAAADRAGTWMKLGWLAIAVGGIYILSAKLSLSLLTPDGVAVFWPAAGVAAGALIASGPWARWAVVAGTMVATIVANLMGDRNLVSSMIFAVCNAGEALLTAGLIERYFGWPFSLDRLRQVLGLLGAAAVAAAVSGIGGTLGFVLLRGETTSAFNTWQNWFASDALGIVTIAPLVIGLASAARDPPRPNETIEGLTALALLVVMSVIAIALPMEPWTTVLPIALLFPILLWISARCRPVFAAAAAFIVTLAIVWTTTIGIGHFGDASIPMTDRVLAARGGILAVALCAYVLAALFAERRQHESALGESEARLQEALTAGAVTTFVWDADTGTSKRSANAAQILGFDPAKRFSREPISLTNSSRGPREFQGVRARRHSGTPRLCRHLPLQAARRPRNLARGNSECRIRPDREPPAAQGPDSRRHRAEADGGPAKPAHCGAWIITSRTCWRA